MGAAVAAPDAVVSRVDARGTGGDLRAPLGRRRARLLLLVGLQTDVVRLTEQRGGQCWRRDGDGRGGDWDGELTNVGLDTALIPNQLRRGTKYFIRVSNRAMTKNCAHRSFVYEQL